MVYKETIDSRSRAFHSIEIFWYQVAYKSPAFKEIVNDSHEKIHSLEKLMLK